MNPRVKSVKALSNYKLEIIFDSGEAGVYDCSPLLGFGVFKELKDRGYFKLVKVQDGTVVWPRGQDMCPDTLYMDLWKPAEQGSQLGHS